MPVKTLLKVEVGDISREVEELTVGMVEKAKSKTYKNLKVISKQPNNSKINQITVKVISQSRVITTERGKYQICNLKDVNGDSTSINLYNKYINCLTPFKIYRLMNLKKGEVTKNDETKMRLHTTGFTKIEDGNMEDSMNFQNVSNADGSITGEVIGFGEISMYESCKIHLKKIDEDKNCPK